ncbi:hypothetical protein EVAR_78307_1 [Eumeta japonica]|uniref:Uncharacterized protein n=1 Tax=Eumeta variegata TaxID=151549 RepID=A0A4C1T3C9_EUMVA|nr:hypothetical protein EVAR_78307_1 [Eumeta japonica]
MALLNAVRHRIEIDSELRSGRGRRCDRRIRRCYWTRPSHDFSLGNPNNGFTLRACDLLRCDLRRAHAVRLSVNASNNNYYHCTPEFSEQCVLRYLVALTRAAALHLFSVGCIYRG